MDKGRKGVECEATERSLGEGSQGSEGARRWRSPAGHPPRGGRWIAAGVRLRAPNLALRSRAEKGRSGDVQKHPTHRATDGWKRAGVHQG